uniref:NADP-dependent oxidoreductase domain-containing protein n=2 Tax=Schizophyllum commune (strain H4-8 / FGSC 9210) TaxID=578458 RepID=D8Q5Y9_SCHCM
MSAAGQVTYRQLGKSGLRISVPILGTMSFGNPEWAAFGAKWVLGEEESLRILKTAWDMGINTFDTSNNYSNGDSERMLAKFIEKYNIPREEIIIATKCFHLVSKDPTAVSRARPDLLNTREYLNRAGLSRAAIFNAVDASLARLNTPYIDLYQIHRFDPTVPAEETMEALHDLVHAGKVRYIGASAMRCWQFAHLDTVAEKNGWTKFVSMQNQVSLLYREEEREMLAYCKFNGIGVIPYSPLFGGKLARPLKSDTTARETAVTAMMSGDVSEADRAIIARVQEIAERRGWKMSQVALAWVASKTDSPIVGANSPERALESAIGGLELTKEEVAYLEEP